MELGTRFEDALVYASEAHRRQARKGTEIPYVSHLLGVTALVLEDGGDEDEAIAALLHDVCEDQGGLGRLEDVRRRFGERVAGIVAACTDSFEDPMPPWKERKDAYIARVREEHDDSALRVSVADKLNNTRTLLRAVKFADDPASVWGRSEQGRDCVLWYYRTLERAFRSRMQSPLLEELAAVVTQLEIVAGGPSAGCTD